MQTVPKSDGFILNGEALPREAFLDRLGTLLTAEMLRVNGGYLFKAGFREAGFRLGIIPGYRYGENYRWLAEVFTECTGETLPLDWITRKLLTDYTIFPEDPASLHDIVQ